MKSRILFIERKYWRENFLAFSLEKIFEQVARLLPRDRFDSRVVKVPYGNSLTDIIKNLLFFKKPAADIYHITGQIHYLSLVLPRDRTVLTMHDLAFLNNGSGLKRYVIKKLFLDLPVRRLKFITAVSEATRQAAITHTGCPPEKIRVIHDPVQEHYLNGSPKSFNKERPTILQIGITENKNIPRLIKALEGINCRVVIVGNMTDDLAAQLEAGRIDYTSVLGLDDQAMRKAYEAADIVSFCSTFEGFGLPIIEAQSMMTPVLTSDLEPMKEVSGGAAYLADPYDIESIRQGILTMINDDGFRERIISEGLVNVQRFLPHKIAAKYQELYDEVLQDANRPIGSQDRNSMNA